MTGIVVDASETMREAFAELAQLRAQTRLLAQRNAQLETALETRIVIEQAKGMLAERLRVSPDEAFEALRRAARSNRVKLHALAAAVVASRETPRELAGTKRFPDPPAAA